MGQNKAQKVISAAVLAAASLAASASPGLDNDAATALSPVQTSYQQSQQDKVLHEEMVKEVDDLFASGNDYMYATEQSAPKLYKLMEDVVESNNSYYGTPEMPDKVVLVNNMERTATAMIYKGSDELLMHSEIQVTVGAIKYLSPDALKEVIGHEVGHGGIQSDSRDVVVNILDAAGMGDRVRDAVDDTQRDVLTDVSRDVLIAEENLISATSTEEIKVQKEELNGAVSRGGEFLADREVGKMAYYLAESTPSQEEYFEASATHPSKEQRIEATLKQQYGNDIFGGNGDISAEGEFTPYTLNDMVERGDITDVAASEKASAAARGELSQNYQETGEKVTHQEYTDLVTERLNTPVTKDGRLVPDWDSKISPEIDAKTSAITDEIGELAKSDGRIDIDEVKEIKAMLSAVRPVDGVDKYSSPSAPSIATGQSQNGGREM